MPGKMIFKEVPEKIKDEQVFDRAIDFACGKNCHLCGSFECNFPHCPAKVEKSYYTQVETPSKRKWVSC